MKTYFVWSLIAPFLFVASIAHAFPNTTDSADALTVNGDDIEFTIAEEPCQKSGITATAELSGQYHILVKILGWTSDCTGDRTLAYYTVKGSIKKLVADALASLPADKVKNRSIEVQLPFLFIQ